MDEKSFVILLSFVVYDFCVRRQAIGHGLSVARQKRKCGIIFQLSGSSSVVERDLAKVDVAGSTPVSRSRFFLACCPTGFQLKSVPR